MDKDKKFNLRKLFAEQSLVMTGIVICIAVMIFCAVRLLNGKYRNMATDTTVSATAIAQQSSKEGAYRMLFANIEMANMVTNYADKLELYSLNLLGFGSLVFRKIITCADPEMPKLEAAMRSLEAHLLIMHKTKDAPELTPASFNGCELMILNFKIEPKRRIPDWNDELEIRGRMWKL
ncbi:MAG: hypothetical protein FWF09_05815 [Bacteroidales bacterium]|nr:hypothetical protein [Bacteroidales bacterium]